MDIDGPVDPFEDTREDAVPRVIPPAGDDLALMSRAFSRRRSRVNLAMQVFPAPDGPRRNDVSPGRRSTIGLSAFERAFTS